MGNERKPSVIYSFWTWSFICIAIIVAIFVFCRVLVPVFVNKNNCKETSKPLTSRYTCIEKLGEGGFGDVFKVKDNKNDKIYAMKKLKNSNGDLAKEAALMMQLNHPNLVPALDTDLKSFIVMPLMEGGNLRSRLIRWKTVPSKVAEVIVYQLMSAIQYLHGKGTAHRDIKPENILLATEDDSTLVRLSDYGLSKNYENSELLSGCGTLRYMAPEIGEQRPYTNKCDVYSAGLVAKECIEVDSRFATDQQFSENAKAMFTKMLETKPEERCDIGKVFGFDWMKSEGTWNEVKELQNKYAY